jgi:hypothetical protein
MAIASIGGCQTDAPYLELPESEAAESFVPKRANRG